MTKKKRIVLIISILFIVIALIGSVYMYFEKGEQPEFVASFVYNSEYAPPSYIFYTPDEADIYADPDYLKVVPYIYYTDTSVTVCITDEDYSSYGPVMELFGKYFDSLKSGNASLFTSLHSKRYFDNNYKWEYIAPQKLYDINVEYLFEKDMSDELYGDVTKYVYKTNYKIMKNNGTFRSDIPSDASRPLYLELVYKNGELFIDACGDSYNIPSE